MMGPEPIEIRDSRWTLALLALPCLLVVGAGVWGLVTGEPLLGGGTVSQLAAIGIAGLVGVVLLQMGLTREPVLRIDVTGVTCRRPDIGLIPWPAVVAIGIARAVVVRQLVMVTVDESVLDPQAAALVRNRVSLFSAMSRSVARIDRRSVGHSTITISLSRYIMPIDELEIRINDMVRRYGTPARDVAGGGEA